MQWSVRWLFDMFFFGSMCSLPIDLHCIVIEGPPQTSLSCSVDNVSDVLQSSMFRLISISGCLTHPAVYCRRQSISCCSCLSVEQSSIAHHCCPLSPSSAVVLKGTLKMTLDMKMQDMKLTDQFAGHEIPGHENDMTWNCGTWNCMTWNCMSWNAGHKSARYETSSEASNVWRWIDWVDFSLQFHVLPSFFVRHTYVLNLHSSVVKLLGLERYQERHPISNTQ